MIVLCCSFHKLKIDNEVLGSFNDVVDRCIFFGNELESREEINSIMKIPIEWYPLVDRQKMRNDIIKLVEPNDHVFMIHFTGHTKLKSVLKNILKHK